MENNKIVEVEGISVSIKEVDSQKYISLTDIAKKKNQEEPRFVMSKCLETAHFSVQNTSSIQKTSASQTSHFSARWYIVFLILSCLTFLAYYCFGNSLWSMKSLRRESNPGPRPFCLIFSFYSLAARFLVL